MESELTFILNNQVVHTKTNPATVLLDFIRKNKRLTGTKEVCKEGDCGACAVLLGTIENGNIKYKTINSCLYPIQKVNGKHIVTIEGLNQDELSLLQISFVDEGSSQCGFCTPGFLISLTGYLLNSSKFDKNEAINAIAGNICRCTGYHSILRSLEKIGSAFNEINTQALISNRVIPKYFRNIPKMLNEISLLETKIALNPSQKLVSGGTDLFVQQPDTLLAKEINFIEDIVKPKIHIIEDQLIISGSATIQDFHLFLKENKNILVLDKLFKLFASLPIRNSATLAGNVINASPIADFTITLLALNAKIVLCSPNDEQRMVELSNFYKGYKTLDIISGEYIKDIILNVPPDSSHFNFEKVSKRTHLDIASVNSAALIIIRDNKIFDAQISAGGVSPIPLLLKKTSEFLKDKIVSNQLLNEIIPIIISEISPISDIRGSKEYKTILLIQLIKAHFLELFPEQITAEVLNEKH
ncbi:MAG: FAD binding domain-containing protein [Melioribacteraceae bacterium]|nr:FAD binding domain-containing protein [Melioribacteraceae bacterium]